MVYVDVRLAIFHKGEKVPNPKGLWKFSTLLWKACNEFVYGKETGEKTSTRRKELLERIKVELERTAAHTEFETKQLRSNAKKSIGNALVPALEVWIRMLGNVIISVGIGPMCYDSRYVHLSNEPDPCLSGDYKFIAKQMGLKYLLLHVGSSQEIKIFNDYMMNNPSS